MLSLKKFTKLALATALVATTLTGCSGNDAKNEGSVETNNNSNVTTSEGSKNIAVIAKGFQHQFWKAVEQGTKKASEEFGLEVTFQGPDNESAIAQQVEYLNAAIDQKPDAICFAALDTQSALDSINNAKDNNIPIIGFDSGVPDAPEGAVLANASTDNYAAAEIAAEKMYDLIKDKVKDNKEVVRIGVVSQESNSQSISERTAGFIDKMIELIGEDKVSVEGHESQAKPKDDAKVVIELSIPAEVKDADAANVATALLEKEDLIAIYGSNEFAANAIITANEGLEKLGADKVIGVGFDSGSKQIAAIKDGLFVGSVTQNPVEIGYQAVKLAKEAAEGKEVEDVDTGALWYNADNMDDEDIAPCLYE
ncbi:MAG: ABC transporter substrate-binding protein [Tissierellia bacterium]|nr:ABC transporter substrate-binding protein [Tissierellia bacterium]